MKNNSSTEVAVIAENENHGTAIAKASDRKAFTFPVANLNVPIDEIPDLSTKKLMQFNLMSDYWSPETAGEWKDLFFDRIEMADYPDQNTGEVKSLRTVFFLERKVTNAGIEMVSISNASAKLVGRLDGYVNQGQMMFGTPMNIKYLGKVKNKTNANFSADWDVKLYILDEKPAG